MDIEHNLLCQYCQLAFDTEKQFALHSCIEIKSEKPDLKVEGSLLNCDSFDLDVSEDFINTILKHVDDLCDIIRKGDPSLQRTTEVNENLNSAVSCYKSRLLLIETKHIEMQDDWDNYDNLPQESEIECNESDSDTDYKPKIGNKAKKKKVSKDTKPKVSTAKNITKKTDLKDIDESPKCQQDSIKNFSESSIKNKKYKVVYIKSDNNAPKEKIKVPKPIPTKDYSYCLELMKEATDNPKNEQIEFKTETCFEFMDLREKDILHCSLCNYSSPLKDRSNMYRHVKLVHKNELKSKSEINSQSIQKTVCERGICAKFYGPFHKKLWCLKCSEKAVEKAQRLKMKTKMRKSENAKQKLIKQKESGITKEKELCPECGSNVPNVKLHIEVNHKIDIQKCPHCDRELMNISKLKAHIKNNHEKTPCIHCGKLVAVEFMTAHILRQHTSNDDKKYKCDVCGKGFAQKQHLSDHKNIHTGEKPYKCKFCSNCFASKGNHGMHERTHLGYRRK